MALFHKIKTYCPNICLRLLLGGSRHLDGDVGVPEGLLLRGDGRLKPGAVLNVG